MPERVGLVGEAHGGHLMLDEIGELGEGHQAHLLRVLDEGGQYHRLGETRPRVSDLRLIAATNRPPTALKHDFLARFSHRIFVPSLNERRGDIPLLFAELVRRAFSETPELVEPFLTDGDPTRPRFAAPLIDRLVRHRYHEHTRELQRLLSLTLTTSRGPALASGLALALTPSVEAALSGSPSNSASGMQPKATPSTPSTEGEAAATPSSLPHPTTSAPSASPTP